MAYDKSVPSSFTKNGIYYFERRVPTDLLKHYDTKKIAYSLRTRSVKIAETRARQAADQLDEYWYFLRSKDVELPGKHRLRMATDMANTAPQAPPTEAVTLSEAVSVYLKLKGAGRPATFHRAAERSCGYVIDVAGDKDLRAFTKKDANMFRDSLIERRLSGSSITRIFGTVRSVTNFAAGELGISITNPFGGVYFDR
ncbi:DUF6538 domain-containing protein [Pseudooceanicola sp.]|uniref:DUF6538 domain-containing protein n=1 Tax=Pseudooceanicola sp. TaxID=1914328 RepID=UPI0035187829